MVNGTMTSFLITSLLVGVVLMGLMSSYILLVNSEGRGEIFDDYPEIEGYNLNLTNTYSGRNLLDTANINSNISAEYNTEISQSGADRSGNAIAINLQNLINLTWATLGFLGVILFGNIYSAILSGLIMSVIAYLTVAYLIKAIRTGET